MKRTEIAMIILIASASAIATFTIARQFLTDKVSRTVTIEQASPVSEGIVKPSKRIFNSDAINPTIEVCVESSSLDEDSTGDDCAMSTPSQSTEAQSPEVADQSTNRSDN